MRHRKRTLFFLLFLSSSAALCKESHITRPPYLTWQSDPSTTMTVNWATEEVTRGTVEYGPTGAYGSKVREKKGTTDHHVGLTGLRPGTRYYYRIDGWLEGTFRTAPRGEEDFAFCCLGHTGGSKIENHYPMQPLIARVREMRPLFLLHTGDTVFFSTQAENFDKEFFHLFAPVSHEMPIMISPANHDVGRWVGMGTLFDYSVFKELFPYPTGSKEGSGIWYTFLVGGVRFIALAHASPPWEGSEQRRWLGHLLERSRADFNVVYLGEVPEDDVFRFLSRYNVSLVLGGASSGLRRETKNGIPYIFCGSLGSLPPPFLYIEYRKNSLFVYGFDATGKELFTQKVEKRVMGRVIFSLTDFSKVKTSPDLTFVDENRFQAEGRSPYFDIENLEIDLREANCVEVKLAFPGNHFNLFWDYGEVDRRLRRSQPVLKRNKGELTTYRYYLPRSDPVGTAETEMRRLRVRLFDFHGKEGRVESVKIYENPFCATLPDRGPSDK